MRFCPRVRTSTRLAILLAGALATLGACKGGDPDDAVVAEVGDEEITVGEVAEYMARASLGMNREAVEDAVDQLIDLELVRLRARERYTPTRRDSLQMKEWSEIQLINQFREDELWSQVTIDEAKLREWYDENVSEEAQVRHILIDVPPTASEAERTAARQRADSLLTAIKAGADFAELARANSGDGSAQNGGLLPWFGKGQMVEPFEEAAFAGPVGEVNPDLVDTQFGYHIIKVEDRRRPSFEDMHDSIEEQLARPERSSLEQAYVTQLMENSGVEFHESNVDTLIARLDAASADASDDGSLPPLAASDRDRELASYRSGRITLGEIWDLYETLPPANQRSIAALDQTAMIQALASLMQQRLLLDEVRSKSVELDTTRQRELDERVDQMYMQSYMQMVGESAITVPDSMVQRYYDEHREFYAGQPFEQVREQIRGVLIGQRIEAIQQPDTQREMLRAVADSQADGVSVQRHEDRYDDVLEALREKYEELGTQPPSEGTSDTPGEPNDAQGN